MTPVAALLHRASYHAEKLFKRRGNFNSVLWLTEHADGHRETRETWCDNGDGMNGTNQHNCELSEADGVAKPVISTFTERSLAALRQTDDMVFCRDHQLC